MADLERLAVGEHGEQLLAVDLPDVVRIDQKAGVAPHEIVCMQRLLQTAERPVFGVHRVHGVVGQLMPAHLDVEDVIGGLLHQAICVVDDDRATGRGFDHPDGLLQLHRQPLVGDGLDDVVQRVHLVGLDGELHHGGDEDQHGAAVMPAHLHGGLHAAEIGQHDVHEHDVEGLALIQEVQRILV